MNKRPSSFSMSEAKTVSVLVMEGFSLLSLGSIVEPFQMLSRDGPESNVSVKLLGLEQMSVRSRCGTEIHCAEAVNSALGHPFCANGTRAFIICGGDTVSPAQAERLKRLLRKVWRAGIPVYGIGGVVRLMAEAGLLRDEEAAIHWRSMASFSELFPAVEASNALFVKSPFGGTCAGELATLDLVMDIIGEISVSKLDAICNQLLVSHVRCGDDKQPGSISEKQRFLPACLKHAIRMMAENIETRRTSTELAKLSGVSVRKLERLFRKHLGISPMQYNASLKVERAHQLLSQTDMPIIEIALATGYSTYGALSKKYQQAYGLTPRRSRDRMRLRLLGISQDTSMNKVEGAIDECSDTPDCFSSREPSPERKQRNSRQPVLQGGNRLWSQSRAVCA